MNPRNSEYRPNSPNGAALPLAQSESSLTPKRQRTCRAGLEAMSVQSEERSDPRRLVRQSMNVLGSGDHLMAKEDTTANYALVNSEINPWELRPQKSMPHWHGFLRALPLQSASSTKSRLEARELRSSAPCHRVNYDLPPTSLSFPYAKALIEELRRTSAPTP